MLVSPPLRQVSHRLQVLEEPFEHTWVKAYFFHDLIGIHLSSISHIANVRLEIVDDGEDLAVVIDHVFQWFLNLVGKTLVGQLKELGN